MTPSTGDQDCSCSTSSIYFVVVFFLSYDSKMDITVGSTSGCSMFVMHCLSSALISLSVQHEILTQQRPRGRKRGGRKESKELKCFVVRHITSLLPLEFVVFVLKINAACLFAVCFHIFTRLNKDALMWILQRNVWYIQTKWGAAANHSRLVWHCEGVCYLCWT